MGEQRVNASFRRRRVEDELRLAAFLRYRIVVGDHDRAVWIPIRRQTHAKHGKVHAEGKHCRCEDEKYGHEKDSPNAIPEDESLRHEARL